MFALWLHFPDFPTVLASQRTLIAAQKLCNLMQNAFGHGVREYVVLEPNPHHLKGQACVAQKQNFCAYGKRLRVNSHEMRIKGEPVEEKIIYTYI